MDSFGLWIKAVLKYFLENLLTHTVVFGLACSKEFEERTDYFILSEPDHAFVVARTVWVLAQTFNNIVVQAPVVQRPFEAMSNPFPYACSKLCHHPIDSEARQEFHNAIERAKEGWANEHRTLLLPDEEELIRDELKLLGGKSCAKPYDENENFQSRLIQRPFHSEDSENEDFTGSEPDGIHFDDDEDRIPEELLLKYTHPDHDLERGPEDDCLEEYKLQKLEPLEDDETEDRQQIVLDLRRESKTLLNEPSKRPTSNCDDKKRQSNGGISKSTKLRKFAVKSNSSDQGPKAHSDSSKETVPSDSQETGKASKIPNKKKQDNVKTGTDSIVEPAFVAIEPEQTQIQTLLQQEGTHGLGGHLGPVHPMRATVLRDIRRKFSNDLDVDNPVERQALEALEAQLQSESAESKFDTWRLEERDEAIAQKVANQPGRDSSGLQDELANLAKELGLENENKPGEDEAQDFWLFLPRTFSYRSSRFEVPVNISQLADMSCVEYLSRFVAVSPSRRHLYNKVFIRHRSLKDGLLNDEATIKALHEVLGAKLNEHQQSSIWSSLGIVLKPHILTAFEYKEFAGIAAFVERILGPQFSTMADSSKSEIEIADFDRLPSKMEPLVMRFPSLKVLLLAIRDSGLTSDRPPGSFYHRRQYHNSSQASSASANKM